MDGERKMKEVLMNMIHGGQQQADDNAVDAPHSFASQQHGAHQEHEEEDDGSQYLALEQGEQEIGDDNTGEVVK